jgi:endonuclease/exonuclease/phosphatase family metal-dependent hydrolase
MKLAFQIFCLFLFAGLVFGQETWDLNSNSTAMPDQNSQFNLMTFNIRYQNWRDGLNWWLFRRSLVVDVINTYSPDILCLQEAELPQAEYILKNTQRSYVAFGMSRTTNIGDESTRILVDPNVFSISSHETYWLSDTPEVVGSTSYGNSNARTATQITLTHKKTGKSLVVTNTHLDHESEIARIKGVEQILDTVQKKVPGNYIARNLIAGDFNNAFNDAQEIKLMEAAGFSDTYFELHKTRPATFHRFTGDAEANFPSKIDHIWRKGALKPINSAIITTAYLGGRYPSDHFPIVCTLELLEDTVILPN